MIVVADPAGRLGNKLLQASHLIAAASDAGFKILLPPFYESHRFFPHLDDALPLYPPQGQTTFIVHASRLFLFQAARAAAAIAVRLGLGGNRWFRVIRLEQGERLNLRDRGVRNQLRSTKLVVLQGWLFRDPDSLQSHRAVVKKVLTPTNDVLSAAGSLVEEARGDGELVVGIHIRQGDYRQHLGGRFFFSIDTYVSVMEQILQLFPRDVRFLVASDTDQDWKRLGHLPCTRCHGHALIDLFALAGCDYVCGPPSSFSLWASFYGDTPLCMIMSPEQVVTREDFRVAPDIRDPSAAGLY